MGEPPMAYAAAPARESDVEPADAEQQLLAVGGAGEEAPADTCQRTAESPCAAPAEDAQPGADDAQPVESSLALQRDSHGEAEDAPAGGAARLFLQQEESPEDFWAAPVRRRDDEVLAEVEGLLAALNATEPAEAALLAAARRLGDAALLMEVRSKRHGRLACDALAACVAPLLRIADPQLGSAPSAVDEHSLACVALRAVQEVTLSFGFQQTVRADEASLQALATVLTSAPDGPLLDAAVHCVWYMSRSADNRDRFVQACYAQLLVPLLRRRAVSAAFADKAARGRPEAVPAPEPDDGLYALARVLQNFCGVKGDGIAAVRAAGGLSALVALISARADERLLEAVCPALQNACISDRSCQDAITEAGGITALLRLVQPDTPHRLLVTVLKALVALMDFGRRGVAGDVVAGAQDNFREEGGFTKVVELIRHFTPTAHNGHDDGDASASSSSDDEIDSRATQRLRNDVLYNLMQLVNVAATLNNDNKLLFGVKRGGVAALTALLETSVTKRPASRAALPPPPVGSTLMALITVLADAPAANVLVFRAAGGLPLLFQMLDMQLSSFDEDDGDEETTTMRRVILLLMNISHHEFLHQTLVAADTVGRMERIIASTPRTDITLFALLLVACAYSSHAGSDTPEGRAADSLLKKRDVTHHLLQLLEKLVAVKPDGVCLYHRAGWTMRDGGIYLRAVTLSSAQSIRLASMGAPALLVELLNATKDAAALQHFCRALLNFAYVPELRSGLRSVGALDAARPHASSADEQTANAAKGVLLHLSDATPTAPGKALSSSPSSSPPKHYRVFLSHRQTDAKAFARGLYNLLTLQNYSTFLDMEYRGDLNDLEAIVGATDNLVFILTDNVLQSEWCRLELSAAVKLGVNIIPVRMEGSLWPNEEGARVCSHPPKHVMADLQPAVREALSSHKVIAHSDDYYQAFIDALLGRLVSPEEAAASRAAAAARNAAAAATASAAAGGATAAPPLAAEPSADPSAALATTRSLSAAASRPQQAPPPLQQVATTHRVHSASPLAVAADDQRAAIAELQQELRALRLDVLHAAAATSSSDTVLLATLGAVSMTCISALALAAMVLARHPRAPLAR